MNSRSRNVVSASSRRRRRTPSSRSRRARADRDRRPPPTTARPTRATAIAGVGPVRGRSRSTTRIAIAVAIADDQRRDRRVRSALMTRPRSTRPGRAAEPPPAAAGQVDPGDPDQPGDDVQDRQRDRDDRGLRRERDRALPGGVARGRRHRAVDEVEDEPGKSPKTTISAPSGASVRISVGVMSVRWWPRPGGTSDSSPNTIRWYIQSR